MKQVKSIRAQVMDFVEANGPMKRTKIIEFLVNTFAPERGPYNPTRDRGYYCGPFYEYGNRSYFRFPTRNDERYLIQTADGKYKVTTYTKELYNQ